MCNNIGQWQAASSEFKYAKSSNQSQQTAISNCTLLEMWSPSLSQWRPPAIVLILFHLLSPAQTLNTLYVKPSIEATCNREPCFTLSEYANDPSQFITNSTRMVLFSGIHYLNKTFTITLFREFSLVSESDTAEQPLLYVEVPRSFLELYSASLKCH